MTNNPEISVVMAVYNGEKYINEAVQSILTQTYSNFELIIIDDASIDETPTILSKLSKTDNRIRIYTNKINLNPSESRNLGINHAKGSFIAIMDADDYAPPDRLSKQYNFMLTHPEITVCGGYMEIYENKNTIVKVPTDNLEIRARLLFENCLCHSTVMFNSKLVKKITKCYKNPPAEDYDFFARLSFDKDIKFSNLPYVLLRYRTHPDLDRSTYLELQRIRASQIRKDQLQNLGLSPQKDELECHSALSCNQDYLPSKIPPLKQCEEWLECIENANNKLNLYSKGSLRKELQMRWINICLLSSKTNKSTAKVFLKSNFSPHSLIKFYIVIKMLWRTLKIHI